MMLHIEWAHHIDHKELEPEAKAEALAAVRDLANYELAQQQQMALADYWNRMGQLPITHRHAPAQTPEECEEYARGHLDASDTYDEAVDELTDWLGQLGEGGPEGGRPRFPILEETV